MSFPGPTTLLEVTGEPDSYIITLVLEPESLPSCIETVLGSKQSSTPLDPCKTAVFNAFLWLNFQADNFAREIFILRL